MKKILPYGILLLIMIALAFPMIYSAGSLLKRKVNRRYMVQKLEHSPLDTISIKVEDVKWFEKGKEIVVNNRMFDIKSWKMVGDTAIFHGLWDDRETAMNKVLRKQAEKKRDQQSAFQFHKLISSWTTTEPVYTLPDRFRNLRTNFTGYLNDQLPDINLSSPSPPPKLT